MFHRRVCGPITSDSETCKHDQQLPSGFDSDVIKFSIIVTFFFFQMSHIFHMGKKIRDKKTNNEKDERCFFSLKSPSVGVIKL